MAVEYTCCESEFFIHILVIIFLVVFAGLMSGLTLGLMSLSLVDLEVLAKSGTPNDRKHAGNVTNSSNYCLILLEYSNNFSSLMLLEFSFFWKIIMHLLLI